MANIVICADGTWNRPERLGRDEYPTNVLNLARWVAPRGGIKGKVNCVEQVVFYDWGVGSYHDKYRGGGIGYGLEKNIMDCYRFLVHNYNEGDEVYLFGFSRGAYTVRSLCGMINNCSILKSIEGHRIEEAFSIYKNKKYKPQGQYSRSWRKRYAVADRVNIHFVGVWDTVGAMGLPFTIFGLIEDKDNFYDREIGKNIVTARHAMALDEFRADFEPTIWVEKSCVDIKQVWFAGSHCDVGGSYKPDKEGRTLSDIPMAWLMKEAQKKGLSFDKKIDDIAYEPLARKNNEYKGKYKLLGKLQREIPAPDDIKTKVHFSVKERYEGMRYTSVSIDQYVKKYGGWPEIEH